jgi:hypothetical protein
MAYGIGQVAKNAFIRRSMEGFWKEHQGFHTFLGFGKAATTIFFLHKRQRNRWR